MQYYIECNVHAQDTLTGQDQAEWGKSRSICTCSIQPRRPWTSIMTVIVYE